MRALRVLLACALLALSAGPSSPARVWTDTAVLIAAASSTPPSDVAGLHALRAEREVSARLDTLTPTAPPAPAIEPANTTRNRVLVRALYLWNRTLLC